MLWVITLVIISIWMVVILRKKRLSLHSIVSAYAIGDTVADFVEVPFALLLGLYKFWPHLRANPINDNELGIVFADTLILPFTLIVFVYCAAKTKRPWRSSLLFAAGFIALEWVYTRMGYMEYIHWNLACSAVFYIVGFRIGAALAPRIVNYNPPIPYRIRLFCFAHTFIMWVGALFASPLLKMYQFKPGLFQNFMSDCRFTDLVSGDVLSILCVVLIPMTPKLLKPVLFAFISCLGITFAIFAYHQGWLVYHQWNHLLTILRYVVPVALVWLYDRWEAPFRSRTATV